MIAGQYYVTVPLYLKSQRPVYKSVPLVAPPTAEQETRRSLTGNTSSL